jgi:hypothetical protein
MASKVLYTVILEFLGGTYIAQVRAASPASAMSRWLERTDDRTFALWRVSREELRSIIAAYEPVKIKGLRGVWCVSGSVRRKFLLINIVARSPAR